MKRLSKISVLFLVVLTVLLMAGCSKRADVNLNNYIAFKYDGFDGNGTVEVSVDYNKLLEEHEKELGEKNSMSALRILRKIEVKADKTEGLTNGETINISYGDINKDEILKESGMNLSFSEFSSSVNGLKELEKLDLFKGLEIKTDGNNSMGVAWIYTYDNPLGVYDIELELEKENHLSNGDKIKVIAKGINGSDIDKSLAKNGYKAESKEYIYTVTGLDELEDYNPFDGVTVKFSGTNGSGTAEIEKDYLINDHVYSWIYTLDKSEGLSNGDVIILSVGTDAPDTEYKDYAAFYGLKPTQEAMEILVEGLSDPFIDINKIDSSEFEKILNRDTDKINSYFNEGMERSVEPGSLKKLDYLGSIITYQEPNAWYAEKASLFNIYRCDVKCSFDEPRWVYWFSLYDDIKRKEDGSFNFDDIDPFCPLNNLNVGEYSVSGFIFSEDNNHFYVGYRTLEDLKGNHIGNANIVFDNINYEEDANKKHSFIPVFANIDITDESGNSLIGSFDYSGIGCVPVYEDGTYTASFDLKQYQSIYTDAPEQIEGLTSFFIRLINCVNGVPGSLDISNVEISDISVVCDGNPVKTNNKDLQTGIAEDDFIVWLFDRSMDITGKNAVVMSKGFFAKERIDVTFTVTGLMPRDGENTVETDDIGEEDNSEDAVDADNTEVVDDADNTGDIEDTDNTEDTGDAEDTGNGDNIGDNGNTDDEKILDSDVNEAGTALYTVVLVKPGNDKVRMIKLVNDYTGLGLSYSKELVELAYEQPVGTRMTDELEIAEEMKTEFEKYGAVVEIQKNFE